MERRLFADDPQEHTDIVRTQDFLIVTRKLTDSIVKTLPLPVRGNRIAYDTDVKGFGVRITAAGARAFVLNYRTRAGRDRPDRARSSSGCRQCGRVGLTATCSQRQKSRASTRVGWSQPTPIAHKNRNQRNRSIP
jgi:hypothetical protein